MADILASTLIAFGGVVALVAATAVVLAASFVLVVARKGDRPVELSPRSAAVALLASGILVGWQALVILSGLPL